MKRVGLGLNSRLNKESDLIKRVSLGLNIQFKTAVLEQELLRMLAENPSEILALNKTLGYEEISDLLRRQQIPINDKLRQGINTILR
jgi:hypothetical protein